MDIINIPGIVKERGILTASQLDLLRDLLLVGKFQTRKAEFDQYKTDVINMQDFINLVISLVPPSGNPLVSVTHAALTTLIGANTLIPGQAYLITDFATRHYIPNAETDPITPAGVLNTGAIEPLIVQAATNNTIHPEAISTIYPSDELMYEVVDSTTAGGDKGRIYYRKDTKSNNTTYYDWRVVKFRRWNDGLKYFTSYDPSSVGYVDYFTFGVANPGTNCSSNYIGPITQFGIDIGALPNKLNNIILTINPDTGNVNNNYFHDNCWNNTFYNSISITNGIGKYFTQIGGNEFESGFKNNQFIISTLSDSYFGKDSFNNQFGELSASNMLIINFRTGDNFRNNEFYISTLSNVTFGNNCTLIENYSILDNVNFDFIAQTTFGEPLKKGKLFKVSSKFFTTNLITFSSNGSKIEYSNFDYFTNNILKVSTSNWKYNTFTYFSGNTHALVTDSVCFEYNNASSMRLNKVKGYIAYNEFKADFNTNFFESDGFTYNTIGSNCNTNTFNGDLSNNIIGNNFNNNTTHGFFENNVIGNEFGFNVLDNYFSYNNIGNSFMVNYIYAQFYSNTVGNNFTNNIFGNEILGEDSINIYQNSFGNNIDNNFFRYPTGIFKILRFNNFDNYFSNNIFYFSDNNLDFYNNQFGPNFQSNTFGCTSNSKVLDPNLQKGISFYDNTIAGNFVSNSFLVDDTAAPGSIDLYFSGNTVLAGGGGGGLGPNTLNSNFESNTFININFINNVFNSGFLNNIGGFADASLISPMSRGIENNNFGFLFDTNEINAYDFYSNTFGNYCYQNHFNGSAYDNKIGDYFYFNTVNSGFVINNNIIGSNCYGNIFNNNVYDNIIGSYFNSNLSFNCEFYSNKIGDNFTSNKLDVLLFANNTIGNFCIGNIFTLYSQFLSNVIDYNFIDNQFNDFLNPPLISVNTFGNNEIGGECTNNKFFCTVIANEIGYHMEGNTIKLEDNQRLFSNTIGQYFESNDFEITTIGEIKNNNIEQSFSGNTFTVDSKSFKLNRISADCSNGLDYSLSTHVFSGYNTISYMNNSNLPKITFIDDTLNTLVVFPITS